MASVARNEEEPEPGKSMTAQEVSMTALKPDQISRDRPTDWDPNFHAFITAANNPKATVVDPEGDKFAEISDLTVRRLSDADHALSELLHWGRIANRGLPANALCRMAEVNARVVEAKVRVPFYYCTV